MQRSKGIGQGGLARRSRERGEAGERVGGSNSVVESQPSKLLVAGSIPVSRSILRRALDALAASDDRLTLQRAQTLSNGCGAAMLDASR